MDFLKNKAKGLIKDYIRTKVEETDFAQLILENVNQETEKLIADKIYIALVESLKRLDDETVADLAIKLKNKALEAVEGSNAMIEQLINDITKKIIENLEKDEKLKEQINVKVKEVIISILEKY
ncbi:hypothetical protein JCM9492_13690 [Aquifex pyrophilus]